MPDTDLDLAFTRLVADVERGSDVPGADRARSTVRAHRARGAGLAGAALLTVGALVGLSTRADHVPEPVAPTTQRDGVDGVIGYTDPVLPTTPIDGHWRTRPLAPHEVTDLLRAAGAPDVLAQWERGAPPGRPRLTLAATTMGGYSLSLGTAGEPYAWTLDWGYPSARGDNVLLRRLFGSSGEARLRPTVTGTRLTLDLVSSSYPGRRGVDGADRVRALYASLPFERFYGTGP